MAQLQVNEQLNALNEELSALNEALNGINLLKESMGKDVVDFKEVLEEKRVEKRLSIQDLEVSKETVETGMRDILALINQAIAKAKGQDPLPRERSFPEARSDYDEIDSTCSMVADELSEICRYFRQNDK